MIKEGKKVESNKIGLRICKSLEMKNGEIFGSSCRVGEAIIL